MGGKSMIPTTLFEQGDFYLRHDKWTYIGQRRMVVATRVRLSSNMGGVEVRIIHPKSLDFIATLPAKQTQVNTFACPPLDTPEWCVVEARMIKSHYPIYKQVERDCTEDDQEWDYLDGADGDLDYTLISDPDECYDQVLDGHKVEITARLNVVVSGYT